jgi:hypothetical protein
VTASKLELKGNIGEWSEIYVLFKLLAEGKIHAADKDMKRMEDTFYTILCIIRKEEQTLNFNRNGLINIKDQNENSLITVPIEKFKEMAALVFTTINEKKEKGTFAIKKVEDFLKTIHIKRIKAKSTDKSDIQIIVHDYRSGVKTPMLGFSIKSDLGGSSSLLNPGEKTNFIYKLENFNPDLFKSVSKLKGKTLVRTLFEKKVKLSFESTQGDDFELNIQVIDSKLPAIIAEMLKIYFGGSISDITDIVEKLEAENPLSYNQSRGHKYYNYKVRNLLTDIALGMTPSKVWEGNYDATGGYIIVKDDGELVCYHIYNRKEFQDYLMSSSYLDTPSTGRYNFGKIYKADGHYKLKLNLQIRFHK